MEGLALSDAHAATEGRMLIIMPKVTTSIIIVVWACRDTSYCSSMFASGPLEIEPKALAHAVQRFSQSPPCFRSVGAQIRTSDLGNEHRSRGHQTGEE